MITNILSVFATITIVTGNVKFRACESKLQSIKVFPSTGETIEWDLKDSFFKGSYLKYQLSQNTTFQIQKPFAYLSSPQPLLEAITKVVATCALKGNGQRVWMNHFAFLNVELNKIDLFYSEGQQGDNLNPPQFSKKINVTTNSSFIQCLGVDYLNQDLFIIDCLDNTKLPFTNQLFVVDKQGNRRTFENSNFNKYLVTTRRISHSVVYTNKIGHQNTFYFRSTPAFATQQTSLDLQSIIEIFYIEEDGSPSLQTVIDAPLLGILASVKDIANFTFSLIDFKVFPNGLIYILTAKQGVYILELLGNGELAFVDRIYPNLEQAYGFDVDYTLQEDATLKEVIAILYDDFVQILEERQKTTSYVLDFIANYPAIIEISQQFLIMQNKGITYLFSTEHEDFIHKETIEGAKGYFINPYIPELVIITPTESKRISLTHGLLRFPSTASPISTLQQFLLLANDTYQTSCKVQITYKVLVSTDYSVQAIDEFQIQDLIYDFPDPLQIEPFVSGPNLNYVQVLQDGFQRTNVVAKFTIFEEMTLESIALPPSTQIIYSDVLILDAIDEKYALLLQTSDKVVTIYNCHIKDKYKARAECVQYNQSSLNITLTSNNFLWWHQELNIYYLTVETDYSAVIRESKLDKTIIIGGFSYPKNQFNKITGVTALKDRFFFILGNRKQIDIRSVTSPYDVEYSITETMVKAKGFTGNWNPQRIFGNRVHNSYIFFIANEDNVIVADYHTQLTIIKTITLSKGTINLAVGIERFFIILKSQNVSLIQEYDLTNLNSVQLMKKLPLYWYTLQDPLQTDFCSHTGVLFVRAYDKKSAQTVILTYGSGRVYRDALLKVVQLGNFIPDGTPIIMSSAGSNQMILYANTGTLQNVYSYFQYPVFSIQPNYDLNSYFSTNTVKFQVSNFDDILPVQYSQTVSLVNTQITITVEQSILDNNALNVTKDDQIFDLSTNWYDGQVVSLDIGCKQCGDKIQPIQTVQQIGSGQFSGYQIIDAAPLNGSRTLYLANKFNIRVFIADSQNELITSYSISLSGQEQDFCDHVAATASGEYIFTTCTSNNIKVVQVAKCTITEELECHQFGTVQTISENTMISQTEVNGQYFFVLNSNPNKPKDYEGALNVYKWTADESQVTFQLDYQFNKTFFGQKPSYFSSFQMANYKYTDSYVKVLLLEQSSNMLHILDGTIANTGIITWQTAYQSLDLYVYINQEGFFVSTTSQFLQIKQVAPADYTTVQLKMYALLTTDNSAHYVMQFDLNWNKITTKSILYVLNQYSHWSALNKVTTGNGYAVIAYTDQTEILLASYVLPAITVQDKPLVQFVGGTTTQYPNPQTSSFVVYIPSNIQNSILYANIYRDPQSNENLITTYKLNTNFQIQIFNKEGKIEKQYIILTLLNKFTQDTGHVELRLVEPEEEQEDESIWKKLVNVFW